MFSVVDRFWEKNPALFYGLAFFLGCLFILETPWVLLPFALLLTPKKTFFPAILVFLFSFCLIYQRYTFPHSQTIVEGVFYTHSIKKNDRFGQSWCYKGKLKTAEGSLFCRFFSKSYYSPDVAYKIKGKVRPLKGKCYALKLEEPLEKVHGYMTLCAWRESAQEHVKNYVKKHIQQERAAKFLIGMITGQLDDRVLMHECSQLGLSHLLAISGLHFSLLALAFHLVFRLFLPAKIEAVCLMCVLTLYLLFIGYTPSITRAWVVVCVFLLGQLLEKRPTPLNSLGVAMLISLIWNPLWAITLSFQLSFLATAGILFFHAPLDQLLQMWLPKRPLQEVIAKHWSWQHGYILLSFFRQTLALTGAVHLAVFPLLLAFFHSFSLNSIVYNLFFPFLASLALLFFLVSIVLGHWAHVANGYYCDWILKIVDTPPLFFKSYYIEHMPHWILALFLTLLLIAAIGCEIKKSTNRFRITDGPLFDHL